MNIAMLFPSYRLFLQAERSYVESAVDTIESCLKAVPRQNLVYLFAEDTFAEMKRVLRTLKIKLILR